MNTRNPFLLIGLTILLGVGSAAAQGTAFTYQGQLSDNGHPANGIYDFRLNLYDALTAGSLVAGPVTNSAVTVSNGLFTMAIDFGAGVFPGAARWLHLGVRTNGAANFTAMSTRQPLTPTPYAITAESLDGSLLAAQLTGTLPGGLLGGIYPNAITLNNAGNSFSGDGSGLTGLNASALASGTVPDARLSLNVALLNRNQTFTGANIFDRGAGGPGRLIVRGSSGVDTSLFTGLSFQYYSTFGEGAIMSSFNDGYGYLSFYTKADTGYPIQKQMIIDRWGVVSIDQANYNNGFLNNGQTNGAGLTFGTGSGEGIASKRTAGGNLYGLDFYTGFANRMSLANAGNLELNDHDLYLRGGGNSWVGLGFRTSVAGIPLGPGGYGPFVFGYDGGALGTVSPDEVNLTWDYSGNVWVSNDLSVASLNVRGEFGVVRGLGNEQAYLGGDGAGNDVQFGSLKSGLTAVAFYNATDGAYMHLYCSTITIEGGADLAEPFELSGADLEIPQGAVVVIDKDNPGRLKMSRQAYDTRVAGVVSGANGLNPGIQMQQQGSLAGGRNVALTGRVFVLADASSGPIEPGDLLTTSQIPGHAMKVADHAKAQGAILGKAMGTLKDGRGLVLVLVTLQ